MKIAFFLFGLLLFHNFVDTSIIESAYSQNFFQEKIRKVSMRKKGIYLKDGIFHKLNGKKSGQLKTIRHFYSERLKRERVVFDFKGHGAPQFYGMINQQEKKLYIDLYKTDINSSISSLGKSKLVKNLNFYPIGEDILSVEVELKSLYGFDIFCLKRPGRLVVDIKE